MTVINLPPAEVQSLLAANKIVLVDVREPNEYAAEHIEGAVLAPLSSFDPRSLPDPKGKTIVLHCAAGARSARAVALCQAAGLGVEAHLAGGLNAWKAAGLPTTR